MEKKNRAPRDIFADTNYYHYIVQYEGDIEDEVSKQPGYYVTIINDKYAILSTNAEVELLIEPKFSTIVYVKNPELFTLEQSSPLEASQATFLQLNLPLSLTGRGVNVAIIDTGIDYLNEEFMTLTGETRIEYIWDQTINNIEKSENSLVPYGTVYNKSEIQEAINAFRAGKSPYDIVATKDEIGHGTNMAGIIGSSGKKPNLRGVVPECNFVIIKLAENIIYKDRFNIQVPIFDIVSIFTAIEFLYRFSLRSEKPMVIYFPLGSNFGNHKGNGILEQYINSIFRNSGIAMVTGTGNQGASGTHTSGIIAQVGESRSIQLYISPEQKNIMTEIWVDAPNIMSINIVSPSGESTGIINASINTVETYSFLFENTSIKMNFYIPEENTGDQLIRIRFFEIKEGIWNFILTGDIILDGKYNCWIPQEGISIGGTRFIASDPYGTIMNPSTSEYIITAAAYNQNNNNILSYSGMAFLENYINVINVAAGGVNALTVAPNNTTAIVNGTSVSAAILTGACVMLFQWGIVDGNDTNMYSQTIKTYIARGTVKRSGDVYPNPQWGYGILNIFNMFQNMI